jgi:hypothetical protein
MRHHYALRLSRRTPPTSSRARAPTRRPSRRRNTDRRRRTCKPWPSRPAGRPEARRRLRPGALPRRHGPHRDAEPDRAGGGPVDRRHPSCGVGLDGALTVFQATAACRASGVRLISDPAFPTQQSKTSIRVGLPGETRHGAADRGASLSVPLVTFCIAAQPRWHSST